MNSQAPVSENEVLELASLAGHILLENGAEISRVEEATERISGYYNVDSRSFFVLSNGIFTTGRPGYAKVEFLPFKGTQKYSIFTWLLWSENPELLYPDPGFFDRYGRVYQRSCGLTVFAGDSDLSILHTSCTP